MSLCPCCRQPFAPLQATVDLNTNTLVHRDRQLRLPPRSAELASILVEFAPMVAPRETIMQRLYGRSPDIASPEDGLKRHVRELRGLLPAIDLAVNTARGVGYQMVPA